MNDWNSGSEEEQDVLRRRGSACMLFTLCNKITRCLHKCLRGLHDDRVPLLDAMHGAAHAHCSFCMLLIVNVPVFTRTCMGFVAGGPHCWMRPMHYNALALCLECHVNHHLGQRLCPQVFSAAWGHACAWGHPLLHFVQESKLV